MRDDTVPIMGCMDRPAPDARAVVLVPRRDELLQRLATLPPVEQLLGLDDLEKLNAAAKQPLRDAAVLLLIVNHADGPTVVFTQRTAHLQDHAGQISFPGGRTHP